MELIVLKNKLFFIGKIKEMQMMLKEASLQYKTLKEFLEGNLH